MILILILVIYDQQFCILVQTFSHALLYDDSKDYILYVNIITKKVSGDNAGGGKSFSTLVPFGND